MNRSAEKSLFSLRELLKPAAVCGWLGGLILCIMFLSHIESESLLTDLASWQSDLGLYGSLVFSAFTLLYFLIQALLAVFYRPSPELAEDKLPSVTVIIPAYNEGRQIADTIESVFKADYPADRLEVIAINDGSGDDTWQWMSSVLPAHEKQLTLVDLEKNQGKKHALCVGITRAQGEVIVTIDSDSEIVPDALRKIVSPFADPKVGAVAGNVRVMNLKEGCIPKMLDTAFAFGFEFMRAAQSHIHTVLCTPGALSAYRLTAVKPLLNRWLDQTFLGRPAAIGEDRAITSMLIREGWHSDFQSNAFVFTRMPVTYSGVFKMLTRWCRSDIRENIIMLQFAFLNLRHFRFRQLGLQLNVLFASVSIILPLFSLPALLLAIVSVPLEAIFMLAAGNILWSTVPAFIYASRYGFRHSYWAVIYGFYYLPFLSWIGVYSVLTLRNTSWITRQLPGLEKHQ
ncbi:MAG: glycosyltransferase family 2 protein [Lentisphaeria bacterium]|nr:glycosyltransferase family 2 protein [Lentisphaeria bacterium]